MLTIIESNILSVTSGYILQQVNCKGVMGAGLAKQIANKYPRVKTKYLEQCTKTVYVGLAQFVNVAPDLCVINYFGQNNYGRNKKYTDVKVMEEGFNALKATLKNHADTHPTLHIPYGLGCGLGGANWDTEVYPLICRCLASSAFDIIIHRLPNKKGGQ